MFILVLQASNSPENFLFLDRDASLPEPGAGVGEGVARGEVRNVGTECGSFDVCSLTVDGEGAGTLQTVILGVGSVQKNEAVAC